MRKILRLIISLLLFNLTSIMVDAQNNQTSAAASKTDTAAAKTDQQITFRIINSVNQTFGYDVYSGKKLIIHQPNIPGLPGNEGFATKAAATDVAQLVVRKIKKGEMPPTVTSAELKKLKVIK